MPNTWSPKKTEVSPGQGDLFSGTSQHLQPDPHFQPGAEVANGVAVSLQERNEALTSAATLLGRLSSNASFREQRHQSGTNSARRNIENSYQDAHEVEMAFDRAESNRVGLEKGIESSFRRAFGFDSLVSSELYPELTEEVVRTALKAGERVVVSARKRPKPGHKEGLREFEERFKGSSNRTPRDRLKRTLGRQATQIKKITARKAKRPN